MNYAIVAKILGTLAYAVAISLFIPLSYAYVNDEHDALFAFCISISLACIVATLLHRQGPKFADQYSRFFFRIFTRERTRMLSSNENKKNNNDEQDPELTLRELTHEEASEECSVQEGIAITGIGWIVAISLSMLPYLIGGHLNFIDSLCETVSGFSGTGATVIPDLDVLPRSVLVWRSITNWIGGLGIIIIFMALVPQFGRGAVYMMQAESTGPNKDRQLPKIRDNAIALLKLYIFLTSVCAICYFCVGMNAYDAVNHALTTIATGGFSTYNDSFIHFHSQLIETCACFFMLLSSGSFGMYIMAKFHGWKLVAHNTEYRVFLLIFALATCVIVTDLMFEMDMTFGSALRDTVFQTASIGSSTGYVSADFELWPSFAKSIILFLMFVGGCGGSTSGGFKVMRLILMMKIFKMIVWQRLHPKILTPVTIDGNVVSENVLLAVARHFFAYIVFVTVISFCLIFDGVPIFDAFSVGFSATGSIGPGFGIVGATSSFAVLPPLSKLITCVAMYFGRLEIFTVITMFTPSFWRKCKGW